MTLFKLVCNARLFGGSGTGIVLDDDDDDGGIAMLEFRAASTSSFTSY